MEKNRKACISSYSVHNMFVITITTLNLKTHLFSFLPILEGLKHFKLSGSKGPPYPTPVD